MLPLIFALLQPRVNRDQRLNVLLLCISPCACAYRTLNIPVPSMFAFWEAVMA